MIKVILVEDDEELRSLFSDTIQEFPDIEVIFETGNEPAALKIIKKNIADALILDLELTEGSGIILLEKMQRLNIHKPFIVVVTNVISETIYNAVRNLGADYVCVKKNQYADPAMILDLIQITANHANSKEDALYKKSMMSQIVSIMETLDFSFELHGTRYLIEILYMIMKEPGIRSNISEEVYEIIAKRFDIKIIVVERAMQTAIRDVWKRKDFVEMKKLYPFKWDEKKGRPTNLEFIENVSIFLQ